MIRVNIVRSRGAISMLAAFALAVCCSSVVRAQATFLVGGDNCDFSSIQPAIDAAASNPGPDTIRVAMNTTYSAQALKIGAQDLIIVGGFATCASATPTPGARTILSGFGGLQDGVLELTGAGNRALSNLVIRDGDETDARAGGGIDFAGEGVLTLSNVTVSLNRAGYGGGINFKGSGGAPTALMLASDVLVQNNIAKNSGGGVRIEGKATLFMSSPRSTITDNEAQGVAADSGYGGGIQVLPPARAEIGSPGFLNFGVVSGNRAKYGGGIALSARDDGGENAYALLYSTDANNPVRVDHNVASVAGGGIYLNTNNDLTASEPTFLCAYEFRIDHNQAPDGAAVYLDNDFSVGQAFGAFADFNVADFGTEFRCGVAALPPRPSAQVCAAGALCNSMDANVVAQASGAPADGAIVSVTENAGLRADRVAWVGNRGSDVIHGLTAHDFDLANCAFTDNILTARVIASDARVDMAACTIAGNQVGLLDVLSLTGEAILLRRNIIWQPGHVALGSNHGPLDGGIILTNDPLSIPLPNTANLDPRFIDPSRADYRLRAASPAIDAGPLSFEFNQSIDLDGLPRHVELPQPNGFGPHDVGAYERQALQPLVLNDHLNSDLAHWLEVTAGVSTFDANENAPDSPAGGAMKFDWNNSPVISGRVVSRAQCIHLPMPGTYKLNGSARTTGSNAVTGQTALLHWDLRHNGSEACTTGPINAQGDHLMASGTAWVRPQVPATITITPQDFTRNSSITISTVMIGTGLTSPPGLRGWFDDISLTLELDDLFADGFETP